MKRGLRRPNMESPLYQRWFPGQGQRGGSGMYGLGDELSDAESGIFTTQSNDPFTTGSGETATETPGIHDWGTIDTSSGETATLDTWQAQADCAEFGGSACDQFVMTGGTPTDAQLKATATLRTLDPSKLASAIASGAVVKSASVGASCPSGLAYKNGTCIPMGGTGVRTPPGQWVSFATNQQLITWGGVVIAALVIINLIPSGGGRRRR